MNKIVIMLPLKDKQKKLIENASSSDQFVYVKPRSVTLEEVEDADIIMGNVPVSLVKQCKKLKWIQLNTAGADEYVQLCKEKMGIQLTNATGAYGLALSEYMLTTLLMLMKKMNHYYTNQLKGLWQDEGPMTSIEGSKVLILGMGNIGTEFAVKMKALGAQVTGVVRTRRAKPDFVQELLTLDQVPEALGQFDVVASSLPGTEETYKIYDKRFFDKMKENSYFLNVGRGTAVVTEDLMKALESGQLAGAAMDVTDPEPLPKEHPLWSTPNVIITPHSAGYFHLPQTLDRIVEICHENLGHFVHGEPLRNCVDLETGYRKLAKTEFEK